MRHNKKFNHLGRQAAHRSAMLSNMSISLIMHKRIFTTTAKAKALKMVVEPLITKAKVDTVASRRNIFSVLQNKEAVSELFKTVSPKVGDRPGGYTRIIKTGYRLGDNAQMCFIELVDFDENMLKVKTEKKARTRRAGAKKKAATDATVVAETPETVVSEQPAAEPVAEKAEKPAAKKALKKAAPAEKPATEEKPAEKAPEAENPAEEKPVE